MISVNDGRASFGTSTAESVKEAYDGTGEFQGRPQSRIRHVASFGFSLMFIYTHPDSSIQSIRISKDERSSTAAAPFGANRKADSGCLRHRCQCDGGKRRYRQSARGAEKKEVDAVFSIARLPVPAYSEMVKRRTLKIIPLDAAAVQALQKRSPLYVDVDIKTFYPDYPRSTRAIGLPGPLVARDDTNPGVVYQMLKIVYARMAELQKMNDGFRGESPETGLRGLAIPLHPGAEKFFSELGLPSHS